MIRPALLLLALAAGCATVRPEPQSYVDTFREEARARGVVVTAPVEVVLVSRLGSAAKCYADSQRVLVSREFWDNADWSDAVRREAVYHELGHCLLHLPHEEDARSFWGHPASIMYPELVNGPWFAANEATYLDRLFRGAKP